MSLNNWLLFFTTLASAAVGFFCFYAGPKKASNIALTLLSAAISGWCFGQFMGDVAASKEAVLFWTRFNIAGAVFIPLFYLYFILSFTNRVKENKRLMGLAAGTAAGFLTLNFTPLFVKDVAPQFAYRFYPVPGIAYPFFAFYLLFLFGIGFFKLSVFLRESRGAINNQAKYVFFGSLVGFLGGMTAFFPVFNLNLPVVSHFSLPLYLTIAVYAIVKHKLLDIRVVIREGLVYSALTALFAAFYVIVVLLSGYFFQSLTRFNEFFTTVTVVFASVLVFQPLRDRVQRGVDRLFFRGSYYYQKTIDDLSSENLKLYRSLQQADKLAALGVVAAGMAHEIKNPLASVKGLTQVLPENLADKDFIQKYSEIVPRQLDRINRIVENLLTFGQPGKLETREIELERTLEEALRLVENQCRKLNIEIVKEFSPVPVIFADPEKLSQAFVNIILNAMQAMPQGGEIKIKTQNSKDSIVIEVSDTGEGIPADRLSNIFDPFYTTKETGSGMGLAVTYRIIKEHTGEIEVESKVGEGTIFKLCLPTRSSPSV
ncbi:hypothetical protein HZB08_01850 [Candidatus Saganbacteria bacterium]|uniref:histidine kinase n=1 Tax=Candidatus Saganbacteria bacterium TaxID=2575572 RepID=A0A9D6UKE8_UNCSA|nr:hypothetical protein [Candidatus Saganbacteria bacterium]